MSSRIPGTVPRRGVMSLPRAAVRVVLVLLCLLVVLAIPEGARGDAGRWQWPLPEPHRVVRAFEPPQDPYGPGHRGIDVAVPEGLGAPVRAVEAGTVRFAGEVAGRGVLSVLHSDGLISTYEPVEASVQQGDVLAAGEQIGVIAEAEPSPAHCAGAICLHLGARQGEEYLDPLLLLGARGPSVLLPWPGAGAAAPPGASGAASVPGPAVSARSDAARSTSSGPNSPVPPARGPQPAGSVAALID